MNIPRATESWERARTVDLEAAISTLTKDQRCRQGSARQRNSRLLRMTRQLGDGQVALARLERIMGGDDLTDVAYLAQGTRVARPVCRVAINQGGRLAGYGTGFLVAPGVLLTNEHVLGSAAEVRDSRAQFRFERDIGNRDLDPVEFGLRTDVAPIIFHDLDMALVGVSPVAISGERIEAFSWLRLDPEPGKAFVGEYLTIIQHPRGERKQVCVRENRLLKFQQNGPFIWYQTDTEGGSSGSPVFNNSWEVVALHHSSIPRTKRVKGQDRWLAKDGRIWDPSMGDETVDWIANEGVRISRILSYLSQVHGAHPLARAVLDAPEPHATESSSADSTNPGMPSTANSSDGTLRVRIPIDVTVRVGLPAGGTGAGTLVPAAPPAGSAAGDRAFPTSAPRGPTVIEKVDIDQTNYDKRPGFDANFLGKKKELAVPLPKVTGAAAKAILKVGSEGILRYWNYSLIMNKTRSLAFFSAANIDPKNWKGSRDADGDRWFRDTRIDKVDKKAQLGDEFYGRQRQFESDRSKNPFDRGHLTRRRDVQWGESEEIAKRNGDDSYHWSNCAPQHWAFNQDAKVSGLWFRLEEQAANAAGKGRVSVINGPVFDAPISTPGPNGRLKLNLTGNRVPDGTFGKVKIPKQFFKVIAFVKSDALRVHAFVVTQEELLASIDRFYPAETEAEKRLSDQEVKLYKVSIAQLSKLTSLDFGSLANAASALEGLDGEADSREIDPDESFDW